MIARLAGYCYHRFDMTMQNKMSAALARAKKAADRYQGHIIPTGDLTRQDRELLVRTHWLQEIIKGWYMLTRPDLAPGDSAAWYANLWDFLRIYLQRSYGNDYCLSAESSLELHAANTVIPQQIIVIAPKGGMLLQLPQQVSLLIYPDAKNIPTDRETVNGLQTMPLLYALCKVAPVYFRKHSADAQILLRSVRTVDALSAVIIQHNFQRAAERLVGAYQALTLETYAKKIQDTLKNNGIDITPKNPFTQQQPIAGSDIFRSPYTARIRLLWQQYRSIVLQDFPEPPGLAQNPADYLAMVEKRYEYDAYHSLSIEGYQVTPELIHRVRNRAWNPDQHAQDHQQRNALAARGYYEAFQAVKSTLNRILQGEPAGSCLADDLSQWYQKLFAPSVQANILSSVDLLGYRNDQVYIRNSRHSPPPKEAVLDCMEAFFDCLKEEPSPAVRAVLGHYIFVFIHPYMDGNGRIARFILNTMLASGGYPWTVVRVENRQAYIDSLEAAHTNQGFEGFSRFILQEVSNGGQELLSGGL